MSKRILVVEDQEDNRQIIRDMLSATDYLVWHHKLNYGTVRGMPPARQQQKIPRQRHSASRDD